ncbi:MAG: VWA domain-containing protein [Bermanella sp.]
MQKVLGDFIHALRHDGLPVSPSETLDALQAARLVGLRDPLLLKSALAKTLAKSLQHQAQFSILFDQFFSLQAPASPGNNDKNDDEGLPASASASQPAQDVQTPAEPSATEGSALQSPLAQQLMSGDNTAMQMAINDAAAAAGASQMKIFTQKPIVTMRIMQALGESQLNQELSEMAKDDQSFSLLQQLRTRQEILRQQVRDFVEQQFLLFSKNSGLKLRADILQTIKLSNIDQSQYQLMLRLVKKAAKQLASLHSRRRKVSKRGLLDVRKTIAANAAYDGFLFHTKWKSSRIERPKIMVLCDVSGSVSRTARFLLLFLYSLQDVLPRVRSFVFTSELVEVSDDFAKLEIADAITEIMENRANLPTDYGKALQDFQTLAMDDIDNKTTVIMLGDARNNNGDGNTQVWQQVFQRSQRVLWLNPEGRFSWDSGDSIMSQYSPYCSRLEHCSSLRDLTRILGSLLKHAS